MNYRILYLLFCLIATKCTLCAKDNLPESQESCFMTLSIQDSRGQAIHPAPKIEIFFLDKNQEPTKQYFPEQKSQSSAWYKSLFDSPGKYSIKISSEGYFTLESTFDIHPSKERYTKSFSLVKIGEKYVIKNNIKIPIKVSKEVGIIGYLTDLPSKSPLLKIDSSVFKNNNNSRAAVGEILSYRVSPNKNKRVPHLLKIRKQPQVTGAGPIVHTHGDIFTVLTQYISVNVNKATSQKEWEKILKKHSLSIEKNIANTKRNFLLEFNHRNPEKVIEIAESLSRLDEIDSVSNFLLPSGVTKDSTEY